MAIISIPSGAKKVELYGKVIRKDGSQSKDILLTYAHRNPIISVAVNLWLRTRDRLGLRGI